MVKTIKLRTSLPIKSTGRNFLVVDNLAIRFHELSEYFFNVLCTNDPSSLDFFSEIFHGNPQKYRCKNDVRVD